MFIACAGLSGDWENGGRCTDRGHAEAEVIIQHDDFVWTAGPFMHPDEYRKVTIPRYAELWPATEGSSAKRFSSPW